MRERDELRLWGWTGQTVSPRLAELQSATDETSPGIPDRLAAIERALTTRSSRIGSLVSYTVIDHLPPLWRAVFRGLQRAGVSVEERVLSPSLSTGDLLAAREPGFAPKGDGSLCLLRRHGPLDLADEVASSLAAFDSLDGVVIIGADSSLDLALARHGLPRVGANAGLPASSRLLSLVIEAAFHPMEMGDLHALLVADPGPIPRPIAANLIHAIRQSPGRRTAFWSEALEKGLSDLGEERWEGVEKRLTDLLLPVCRRDEQLPVPALRKRLEALNKWAHARMAYVPSLLELSNLIQTLLEAVELWGMSEFSWHQLRRLCDDLGESPWLWQPAQAGLVHVARPGAILAPARAIVWWNFSRDVARRPERLVLSRSERDGLLALGVKPPELSLAVSIEAEGWRRPLLLAMQALILACPLTDPSGEPNYPHPLWDDVTAALVIQGDVKILEVENVTHLASAKFVPVTSRPLVAPAPSVTLKLPIAVREVESPSSIEKLLGCSLSWALKYRARLRPGLSAGPPLPGPLIFGVLAHRILELVLNRMLSSDEEAADLAGTLFDQNCDNLFEEMALPQNQAARATVRRAIVESARELLRLSGKHGVRSMKSELLIKVAMAGQTMEGRLDLVWDDPAVLLDLKWGKGAQMEKLKTGTAIQLAAYAAMREAEGWPSEAAYFVLQSQELLAEPGGRFSADAKVPGNYRVSEIWSAVVAALDARRRAMAQGRLDAPGATGDDLKSELLPSGIEVAPPCKYCDFTGLCGRGGAR